MSTIFLVEKIKEKEKKCKDVKKKKIKIYRHRSMRILESWLFPRLLTSHNMVDVDQGD